MIAKIYVGRIERACNHCGMVVVDCTLGMEPHHHHVAHHALCAQCRRQPEACNNATQSMRGWRGWIVGGAKIALSAQTNF